MTDYKTNNDVNAEEERLASMSETVIANSIGLKCGTVLCVILGLAYVLEFFKGARTLPYTIVVVLACAVPLMLAWGFFKKNNGSRIAVMRTLGIGFTIMYTLFLFTANNDLVFTYVMPMLLILMIFNNKQFVMIIGIGAAVENVIAVIVDSARNGCFAAKSATYEIQVLLIILCVIYFILVNRTYDQFSEIKAARLDIEKNRIGKILSTVLGISGNITEEVDSVHTKVGALRSSMENTLNAMQEVSSGNNETAEAVQNQLHKTEEIQENITSVKNAAEIISDNMDKANDAVNEGQTHIRELTQLTQGSEQAGEDVAKALESFQEYTGQMNNITSLINNVASQTSLLSLNASIEAARAGEAGRGFAVVAEEIGNLANDSATTADEIRGVMRKLIEVSTDATNKAKEVAGIQNEVQSVLDDTVVSINELIDGVSVTVDGVSTISGVAEECAASKAVIVDAMSSLSAISEENAASSQETSASMQELNATINELAQSADGLNSLASDLNEDVGFFTI